MVSNNCLLTDGAASESDLTKLTDPSTDEKEGETLLLRSESKLTDARRNPDNPARAERSVHQRYWTTGNAREENELGTQAHGPH